MSLTLAAARVNSSMQPEEISGVKPSPSGTQSSRSKAALASSMEQPAVAATASKEIHPVGMRMCSPSFGAR